MLGKEHLTEEKKSIILDLLDGDENAYNQFKRFRDKDLEKKIRGEIDEATDELLDTDFKEEYEKALAAVDDICRRAWEQACEDMGYSIEEFPSKY